MAKKKIDESLLIEMAAKGFPKSVKPQSPTPKETAPISLTVFEEETQREAIQLPPKVRQDATATYKEVFLKNAVFTDRVTQALNRETAEILRNIVTYTGNQISVATFIENILREHLHQYRDLLNELTAPNIPQQVIPKL